MYGGAVFDLDGRHFDLHFRNLDVVEHWTHEANEGRFEVHILGFHLAGIPTYMLPGELATSRTLRGDLPRPLYPDALRRTAPPFWLGRANRELDYANYWAVSSNPISCAGALAKAPFKALTLAWPTEASGHSTRSEWSNGRTSPVSLDDSQASVRQVQT
jgi:hypothetical protein